MEARLNGNVIRLGREYPLTLRDAAGTKVEVLSGSIWLTEENVAGDRIGRRGECLMLEGKGLAVIEALAGAELRLHRPVTLGETLAARFVRVRPGAPEHGLALCG